MNLTFVPLDLERNRELILRFREDSFVVSFGSADGLLGPDGQGAERYLKLIAERNRWPGSCVHVCCEGEIIGQIEMRANDETHRTGYVNLFYLAPEWRGKGVSKALDDYATSFFLRHGMKMAFLNVSPTNARALRFYEKCGWKIIDRIIKSGANVFVMSKQLT